MKCLAELSSLKKRFHLDLVEGLTNKKEIYYKQIQIDLAGLISDQLITGNPMSGADGDMKLVEGLVIKLVNNGLTSAGPQT